MNKFKIMPFIRKYLWWMYRPIKMLYKNIYVYYYRKAQTRKLSMLMQVADSSHPRIFYLGITEQPNLGDMAQHYCILEWIKENYPEYELVKFESSVVTDARFGFIEILKNVYRPCDIIIFQSGYCTQDLGGDHELMHRLICDALPEARILMMPQTVFFQHEENRLRTSRSYNQARNMLFLARDAVSFEEAKLMFKDIRVRLFPDIVTTLIGLHKYNVSRAGICLCCRNDGEKFYTEEELAVLTSRLEKHSFVDRKDTQGLISYKDIRKNLWYHIEKEIESYSHYQATITDRYHGTIFSLAAGTPVIIIKTTDHKVVTGADWFTDVCGDCIYVATDLLDAERKCIEIMKNQLTLNMGSHFRDLYYNRLRSIFDERDAE